MIVNNMCIVIFPSRRFKTGLQGAAASQTSFFTLGALIAIGVSTLSPGKPPEDSKLSRPFMGRQASWLSELSTSTTAGKLD